MSRDTPSLWQSYQLLVMGTYCPSIKHPLAARPSRLVSPQKYNGGNERSVMKKGKEIMKLVGDASEDWISFGFFAHFNNSEMGFHCLNNAFCYDQDGFRCMEGNDFPFSADSCRK